MMNLYKENVSQSLGNKFIDVSDSDSDTVFSKPSGLYYHDFSVYIIK